MAIKESALSLITSIAQGDWIRAVTSAGASRRVTVANLAKAIVESYTGSSLAGSSQSVKAAIDSLNSKMAHICRDTCRNKNLNNMNTTNDYGIYWYNGWGSADVGGTLPFTNATGILLVMDNGYGGKGQVMWNLSTGKVFRRTYENSSWSSWASS